MRSYIILGRSIEKVRKPISTGVVMNQICVFDSTHRIGGKRPLETVTSITA